MTAFEDMQAQVISSISRIASQNIAEEIFGGPVTFDVVGSRGPELMFVNQGKAMNRAYAVLDIKSVDDEQRIIQGIASTPTPDRMQDVVVPTGAKMSLPLPFLYQHNSKEPIGRVVAAKVADDGISITAQIAKGVAPFIDDAWALIKAGLVRGLSIGFRPIGNPTPIKGTHGLRFDEWELLEVSAVTIPAQSEASISVIKSLDDQQRAASGIAPPVPTSPGVPGKPLVIPKGKPMKPLAEQIAGFEAKRAALVASNDAVMTKAAEEGRTLDETEKETYDGAGSEIKSIDEHLVRLRDHEKAMVAKAVPVTAATPDAGTQSRQGVSTILAKDDLPPGIEFARYVKCLAAARGNLMQAYEIAKSQYPDQTRIHTVLKAAVNAGTTTDTTWAAPLIDYQHFAGDFVEFLRPQTIIGKFGSNGVPSLFRVPFNITIPSQTSGGAAYWVGEGAPKPLTKFDFATTNLRWAKVAAISVLTDELVRFSSPSADMLVRNALAAAVIERIDIDFVDPAKVAVTNVSPASITNGVTPLQPTGPTAANFRTDVQRLFATYIAANMSPMNGVWLMTETTALALFMSLNALGQPNFPGLTMKGGTLMGMPVIVSQYVKSSGSPTESILVLVNASDIYLADDGQVVIDASREASLQMLDNPTNNSGTATATTMVSMFQTNSVAIRAERFINWQRRRTAAVAYIENVAYTGA